MADWVPKTRLGQMVLNGDITTMSDALATKLPLREPEIVDILLPDLKDEAKALICGSTVRTPREHPPA